MTKTKTILGLSLAAVFAVSMIGTAYAAGHLAVTDTVFDDGDVWITTSFTVHSGAPNAYGYAVPLDNGGFLVVATHPGADDSDRQKNPRHPVFHVHYLEAAGATDCTDSTLQATHASDPDAKLKIKNNMIHVTDIDLSDTDKGPIGSLATGFTGAAAFGFFIDKVDLPDFVCFTPV